MFDTDLLIAFFLMALLFLRQIYILKQPNKINYAPLMLGIGALSSLIHFIAHPEILDILLLVRESLFPIVTALLLYIVMNIMHQTQQSENARLQQEFSKLLVEQVTQMKEYMRELELRMIKNQEQDREAQKDIREKFINDIKTLDAIQINQSRFLEKFDEIEKLHKGISQSFEYFANTQLPELDNVVHKHIDILRIAEQDHHNKVKAFLAKAIESRADISDDIESLKETLQSIKNVSDEIAHTITQETVEQLADVTQEFQKEIVSLKTHAEGVSTSLYEGENTISAIREQSELLMKQMVLTSNKMGELEVQNDGLHDIYTLIKDLVKDMEVIKADYVKSQSQLSLISKELQHAEDKQIAKMTQQIELFSKTLSQRVDESLEKLHEHYHIAENDITQSVQVLAKKAQMQKGYSQSES